MSNCPVCQGIGEVNNKYEQRMPCEHCDGTGEVCSYCGEASNICNGDCCDEDR